MGLNCKKSTFFAPQSMKIYHKIAKNSCWRKIYWNCGSQIYQKPFFFFFFLESTLQNTVILVVFQHKLVKFCLGFFLRISLKFGYFCAADWVLLVAGLSITVPNIHQTPDTTKRKINISSFNKKDSGFWTT